VEKYLSILFALTKNAFRREVSDALFRFFTGFILSVLIIYSAIQFGDAYHVFSKQFQEGYYFELLGFGLTGIVCTVGLFKIFKSRAGSNLQKQSLMSPIDLDSIVFHFTEGFLASFEAKKQSDEEKISKDLMM